MAEATTLTVFAVEANHPQNSDLLIQCIPGCRLRSQISGMKTVRNFKTGKIAGVPKDRAIGLGSLPPIPGMVIRVNPYKGEYEIFDPLVENEELCMEIAQWMRDRSTMGVDQEVRGVPATHGKLDKDTMKTLCRELYNIVQAEEGEIVEGAPPTLDLIDELPGSYLLNPGSRVFNSQPRLERDFDDWVQRVSSASVEV